ncbi:MAG: TRAP transporter substrate-binding protein DctP, partial [Fidelibacterota bacterium]
MATLAPEGSPWHELLVEMGQGWHDATGGEVVLRIYPGGVAGDERDVIRKIRIKQLHAAAITIERRGGLNDRQI